MSDCDWGREREREKQRQKRRRLLLRIRDGNDVITCRGKLLSLLFDVGVLLLITTGTPHSHIRAYGPSAITHGMLSLMHSG